MILRWRKKTYDKVCEICGTSFTTFAHNAKYCPDCRIIVKRKASAKWNKKPETLEYKRQWNRKNRLNPEVRKKDREKCRKYRAENREKCRLYHRAWVEKNRELYNLNQRIKYYDKCVEYWNSQAENGVATNSAQNCAQS